MSLVHKDRISELDSLKALALVMMLISNFVSDLSFFKIMEVTKGDPWWYLARITASLFVCISGVSYYLANRESPNFTRVFLRTKKLIFWAFIITIVTLFFSAWCIYSFWGSASLSFGQLSCFLVCQKTNCRLSVWFIIISFTVVIGTNVSMDRFERNRFFCSRLFPIESLAWIVFPLNGFCTIYLSRW